ncbi:MAG: 23S rRNA (uracil-5-)-methyltransferase RumA [Clostridiales bacterium GWF2_38_85]|nr:MAG: 23S rRNA (uracil-5-)-methyltransferase RumA [Clostridiales bacterium GWF2_38_85]HBL85042.1 23S rRNA (uracil(1939)-C(5))-methyltransferase RlmD [Clostridiales bacterium]
MKNSIKINEIIEITDMTTDGTGVGRLSDGRAVFVSRCAVGDIAEVLVIKDKKSFAIGRAVSFNKLSPDRTDAGCPQYVRCGGCSLRHISYPAELKAKQKAVRDAMERIGGLTVDVAEAVSVNEERYRNKAQYPLCTINGKTAFGFYARNSHQVVPHEDCIIQPEIFHKIAGNLCKILDEAGVIAYDENSGKGLARHIILRSNLKGEIMCILVINSMKLNNVSSIAQRLQQLHPEIVSFYTSSNTDDTNVIMGDSVVHILGKLKIEDTLCGQRFLLSPLSFYQVNRAAAELLYYKAKELAGLKPGEVLLDLYCGVGTIGLSISGIDNILCGVETVEAAIEDARENAMLNGRNEADTAFYAADAGEGIKLCKEHFGRVDVVIVDPPRKGLTPTVIDEIAGSGANRIVYISCNPATMARDLKLFTEKGFNCGTAHPYNFFPRTEHVESIILMTNSGLKDK